MHQQLAESWWEHPEGILIHHCMLVQCMYIKSTVTETDRLDRLQKISKLQVTPGRFLSNARKPVDVQM